MAANRQEELENLLKKYSEAYYNGEEIVSDEVYDTLYSELKNDYPTSSLIKAVTEKTNGKLKHHIITGTLEKCASEYEFVDWYKKHPGKYLVSYKMDGNSQELIYSNGKFVQSISRGDGFYGEDTTKQMSSINFPKAIPGFNGSIRGEVMLSKKIWKEKYSASTKNARNCSAGLIKRLNCKGCEDLEFFAYDVDEGDTLSSKFDFLQKAGFIIPKYIITNSLEEILKFRNDTAATREEYEYDIDGIVVKNNVTDKEDLSRHCPLRDVAIKFDLVEAVSKILDIEWGFKGTFFSPVAILAPVELCGTTVQRASLHNVNKMTELGIDIGKTVLVCKGGEIIPKVIKVLDKN